MGCFPVSSRDCPTWRVGTYSSVKPSYGGFSETLGINTRFWPWRSVLVTHFKFCQCICSQKYKLLLFSVFLEPTSSQPAELRQLWIHKQHRAEHTMAVRPKECVGNYKVIQTCKKCPIRWALSHLLLIGFYLSIKALSVTLSTFISVLFEWKWQKM